MVTSLENRGKHKEELALIEEHPLFSTVSQFPECNNNNRNKFIGLLERFAPVIFLHIRGTVVPAATSLKCVYHVKKHLSHKSRPPLNSTFSKILLQKRFKSTFSKKVPVLFVVIYGDNNIYILRSYGFMGGKRYFPRF
jgi:hypothetical protein